MDQSIKNKEFKYQEPNMYLNHYVGFLIRIDISI